MIQALRNSGFFTRIILCILVSFGSQGLLICRRTCSKASGRPRRPGDGTERSWSHYVIQIEFWGKWIINVSWFCKSNFLQNENFLALFSVLFSALVKNKFCNIIVCLSLKTGNYFTHYHWFIFPHCCCRMIFVRWQRRRRTNLWHRAKPGERYRFSFAFFHWKLQPLRWKVSKWYFK